MNKKIVICLGFLGSIASIFGFLQTFDNESVLIERQQIQVGENNIQAGGDVIVNHTNTASYEDGVFLYEEQVENYWNEWWAHPLQSKQLIT